jgi:glyoxylase-like metal-dependent hydrolase (beta-lactamase superfamily II)
MRAVGVHADVIVVTSAIWQTTCTAVRSGDEGFVIDSPVLPAELETLPSVLEQSGFAVSGLLATHGDWDHLLGRLAFPGAALGVAETTAARLRSEPGAAQRELRAFDDEHYVVRPAPLSLGDWQPLPVPGRVEIGGRELELHPADGHTPDGMAVWIESAGCLVAGDYLSPVEIPMVSQGGSLDGYLATLRRLRALVARAEAIVAGHGGVLHRDRALALLEEDEAYLQRLHDLGARAPLPPRRRSPAQTRIHAENVERVAGERG